MNTKRDLGISLDGLMSDLDHIQTWSRLNRLKLNPNKTKYIIVSPRPYAVDRIIWLGDTSIKRVSSFKYLGLIIQDNFKFNVHISNVVASVSRANGMLYSFRYILSHKILRLLYFSFI